MGFRGEATFVFTDINTGEVTQTREEKNFIVDSRYLNLFIDTGTNYLYRVCIYNKGDATYPMVSKKDGYYGNITYYTGYAPAGKSLRTFFPKTSESPAYWEFYSLYLPPASTQAISSIGLQRAWQGDNETHHAGPSSVTTAINLNPPCYQSPTEYLNVYYRFIWIEDEDDDVPEFIKEIMALEPERGSGKYIYPNDSVMMYPFKINEFTTKTGRLNYLSDFTWNLVSKNTVHPDSGRNLALWHARKIHNWPDDVPNQYNQIQNSFVKTMVRGGRSIVDGEYYYLHPTQFIPDIGVGSGTGIGNVFATETTSNSPYFDPTYFPIGSGRMYATGQWNPETISSITPIKEYQPKRVVATITKTGAVANPTGAGSPGVNDAGYRIKKYSGLLNKNGFVDLPLFPTPYYANNYNDDGYGWPTWETSNYMVQQKNRMFKEPEKNHFSHMIMDYEDERAFITWDRTGFTLVDVIEGKLLVVDQYTTPQLLATNIVHIRTDIYKNIWVACTNTGLWKVQMTDYNMSTLTITHIGQLPGSQQKCYALDCDNFGNVWAVFWGVGLYYTSDQGATWVNAIINYGPFSDMDSGSTDSQWRFCSRIVVNPHMDASALEGQVLLLMPTNVNNTNSPTSGTANGSATAGCWYDLETASTTGITNSDMRTKLAAVRDFGWKKMNIGVSNLTGKWVFLTSSSSSGQEIRYVTFGQNSTSIGFSHSTNLDLAFSIPLIDIQTVWDENQGSYVDLCLNGTHPMYIYQGVNNNYSNCLTNLVNDSLFIRGTRNNDSTYGCVSYSLSSAIRFGVNQYIGFKNGRADGSWNTHGFILTNGVPPTKAYSIWSAENYGWNGSAWVKDYLGSKPVHLSSEEFEKGIMISFENGPVSTTSWSLGDQFTFTCFDGFYKDNSSKIEVKDTVYFKPKNEIGVFTPSTVQLFDRTSQAGLINGEINTDWNIDQLPDTVYSGGAISLTGDEYYSYVPYMNWMYNTDFKEEKSNTLPSTVTGVPTVTSDFELFGNNTTYLNGEEGFVYASASKYSFGSGNFTLEGWFRFEELGITERYLWDFRGAASEMGLFYVSAQSQLAYWNGSSNIGNTGTTLVVDTWYHIAFTRSGDEWRCFLDGIQQWQVTLSTGFSASRPMYLGRSYALISPWVNENLTSVTNNAIVGPLGTTFAEAFTADTNNSGTHGLYRYNNITTGQYTYSIYVKKGNIAAQRYCIVRCGINNVDSRAVYDFDTDTFTTTPAGVTLTKTVLAGGWVRIGYTATEATAGVSRYFSIMVSDTANPSTSWAGTGTDISMYVWGAQLEVGASMTAYEPSGSSKNLFATDSENFYGSYRGFKGWMSNIRLTKTYARYTSNFTVPATKFSNSTNNYSGARLKLPGQYNEGGIVARKELVGNWSVLFHNIEDPTSREVVGGRNVYHFGISPTRNITYHADIGFRITQGFNGIHRYEQWRDDWGGGHNLHNPALGGWFDSTNATTWRFRKQDQVITISFSNDYGITWRMINQITTYDPIHYICFWQNKPVVDLLLPAVQIEYNGSDYISMVGDANNATGYYHPRFLCSDNYWEHDWQIKLNGVKTTKNRSNFQGEGLPLAGECRLSEFGVLTLNAADAGKAITGKVVTLRN